mmetsp:Transcript_21202/g.49767  ORF Transcript_21202/g.49767 Transcript_21202/m.49767 type:complete len:231 (-) Transcript_21202:508-1200(-)
MLLTHPKMIVDRRACHLPGQDLIHNYMCVCVWGVAVGDALVVKFGHLALFTKPACWDVLEGSVTFYSVLNIQICTSRAPFLARYYDPNMRCAEMRYKTALDDSVTNTYSPASASGTTSRLVIWGSGHWASPQIWPLGSTTVTAPGNLEPAPANSMRPTNKRPKLSQQRAVGPTRPLKVTNTLLWNTPPGLSTKRMIRLANVSATYTTVPSGETAMPDGCARHSRARGFRI